MPHLAGKRHRNLQRGSKASSTLVTLPALPVLPVLQGIPAAALLGLFASSGVTNAVSSIVLLHCPSTKNIDSYIKYDRDNGGKNGDKQGLAKNMYLPKGTY